jgi:hypothetical protein
VEVKNKGKLSTSQLVIPNPEKIVDPFFLDQIKATK